jgi:4'-phosphopantetheinyl transferase
MPLRCVTSEQVEPLLQGEEIHVWTVTVSDWLPFLTELAETLNHAERERVARFRFERDRRRFSLCRGLLRTLLGDYLSIGPREVEFQFGPQDKPGLASPTASGLEFNLSHSDEVALFAFAAGRRVGVDVERIRSRIDVIGLAKQVFTPLEIERVSVGAEPEREDLFFTFWTLKEAYIKAIGLGLSAPVREITVGAGLAAPAGEKGIGQIEGYGACWSLLSLPARLGYKAALAVENRLNRELLRVRPLQPSRFGLSPPGAGVGAG